MTAESTCHLSPIKQEPAVGGRSPLDFFNDDGPDVWTYRAVQTSLFCKILLHGFRGISPRTAPALGRGTTLR